MTLEGFKEGDVIQVAVKPARVSTSFREVLLQTVDEGLALTCGETVRDTVVHCLQSRYGLRFEELPEKLDSFDKAVRELLGPAGSVVERMMAKNLYSKLNIAFTPHKDWTLVDYVHEARKMSERG